MNITHVGSMHRPSRWIFTVCMATLGFSIARPASAQAISDDLVLQLTTAKGAEVTVPKPNISSGDSLLDQATMQWSPDWKPLSFFYLQVGQGCYLVIPVGNFRRAERKSEAHIVTLLNNQQLQGKLAGYVESPESKTKHDLATVTMIQVVNLPSWERDRHEWWQKRDIESAWLRKISFTAPIVATHQVFGLDFVLIRRTGSGDMQRVKQEGWGSGEFVYLGVGEEQKPLKFADYEEMSFEKFEGTGEPGVQAEVRAAGGGRESGVFVLKTEDGTPAQRWFLQMILADRSGIQLAVTNPTCKLTKNIQ